MIKRVENKNYLKFIEIKGKKMKKLKTIKLFLFILILLNITLCKKEQKEIQENKTQNIQIQFLIKTQQKEDKFELNLNQPKKVIEIMEQLKQENKLDYEIKNYNELTLIVSINEIKNQGSGKNKKNWIYAVNGKLSPMAVNQMIIDQNSKIEWCYIEWENRTQCGEETQNLDHEPKKEEIKK